MFGIDSTEFLLIAVVALVVIGPKDLPRVMRLVGGWVGRGKAMTRHLRAGFDTMMREAEIEEMQKQWAKQNADIMAVTNPAAVGHHAYDAAVGDQPYDHPGAVPKPAMIGPQPALHALAEPELPLAPTAQP